MKRISTLIAAAALGLGTQAAEAADIYGSKDSGLPFQLSSQSWTGPYIALGAGYGFAQSGLGIAHGGTVDLSSTGTAFTGRAGYDISVPVSNLRGVLCGAYVEGGNNFDVNGKLGPVSFGEQWNYGAGVRCGLDYGTGLAYIPFGYTHQDISFSGPGAGMNGYKYGFGLEEKIGANWGIQLEFTQARYDSTTLNGFFGSTPQKTINDAVTLSLVRKF